MDKRGGSCGDRAQEPRSPAAQGSELGCGQLPSLPSVRGGLSRSSVSLRPVELKETSGEYPEAYNSSRRDAQTPLHFGGGASPPRAGGQAAQRSPFELGALAMIQPFGIGLWKAPCVGQKLAWEVILWAEVIAFKPQGAYIL